jgi:hypothetical protein
MSKSFETAVRRVGAWGVRAVSLGVSQSNDLAVGQSPDGKNVTLFGPVTKQRLW